MEVILLERIDSLGQMGDVVNVKPGYARNYLLPQKKALRATEENRRHFEEHRAQLQTVNVERRTAAEQVATRLEGLAVVLIRQAGEAGQLYGSVNARDIAHEVTRAGFTIERRQVQLPQPIKALGLYEVRIALHPELGTGVTVNVARSEDEAQIQAKTGKAVVQLEEEEKEKDEKAATGQEEKGREGEGTAPGQETAERPGRIPRKKSARKDDTATAADAAGEPADREPGDGSGAAGEAEDSGAASAAGAAEDSGAGKGG